MGRSGMPSVITRMCKIGTILLASALLAFGATQASASNPVRIGLICPFTGGASDFGNSVRLGAELAVAEINEVGGFLGRPIELIAHNDKSDPAEGKRIAEELVEREKVAFTVGYCNTGVAVKSLEVFQRNRSVLVVPMATGSAVTAEYPTKESYIFRMAAREGDIAAFLVDEVIDKAGHQKVAVFADKTAYGEGGLSDLLRLLKERGLVPVHIARFDIGAPSLVEELKAAKTAGAQAVIGYALSPEFITMLKGRVKSQFIGPIYGSHPLSFLTVWERTGTQSEGARMAVTMIHDLSNERRSSFIARLYRHAKTEKIHSLMAAAQSYDAVHLMLRAMFQTPNDTSGPALKAALEDLRTPYRGVVTNHVKPFSADDHDAFTRNMLWLGRWSKGEIVFAHTADEKKSSVLRVKSAR